MPLLSRLGVWWLDAAVLLANECYGVTDRPILYEALSVSTCSGQATTDRICITVQDFCQRRGELVLLLVRQSKYRRARAAQVMVSEADARLTATPKPDLRIFSYPIFQPSGCCHKLITLRVSTWREPSRDSDRATGSSWHPLRDAKRYSDCQHGCH